MLARQVEMRDEDRDTEGAQASGEVDKPTARHVGDPHVLPRIGFASTEPSAELARLAHAAMPASTNNAANSIASGALTKRGGDNSVGHAPHGRHCRRISAVRLSTSLTVALVSDDPLSGGSQRWAAGHRVWTGFAAAVSDSAATRRFNIYRISAAHLR
jgi:hypothetical protein